MSELRIGTAEREIAITALGDHYAEGRLSAEEHEERSEAAWAARTALELAPLFADLPGGSPVPATVGQRPSPAAAGPGPVPAGPGVKQRLRSGFGGLPTAVQVLLAVIVAAALLSNLPLVIVAGLVWFLFARHHRAPRPPWAHDVWHR